MWRFRFKSREEIRQLLLAERLEWIHRNLLPGIHQRWGANARILDLGCGDGWFLHYLIHYGGFSPGSLVGMEPDTARYTRARELLCPQVNLYPEGFQSASFSEATFDVIILQLVMSVLPSRTEQDRCAKRCWEWLKPGGWIFWYDIRVRAPWQKYLLPVSREYLERKLFPRARVIRLETITVNPVILELLGKAGKVLYPLLRKVKGLRTHWIGILEKPA